VADFDPANPSIARVYDYFLGGKDNFASDRAVAEQLISAFPSIPPVARGNKAMLTRAARWAAEQGITQFIDLGCGMPTEPSTQQTVQAVVPDARVAYVDIDPVVLSHLASLHYEDPAALVVDRDAGDAEAVLEEVAGFIDLGRPVCLLMGALLHFYEPEAARDLAGRYTAALAPGSHIVLTVVAANPGPDTDELVKMYSSGPHPMYVHSAEEFASFFGDLEMVPPGVADVRTWRPGWDIVPELEPLPVWGYAGMARIAG
jgi:hypothetical protein